MSKAQLLQMATHLRNVLENNATKAALVFSEGGRRVEQVIQAIEEASELEHALLDLFQVVKERITAELGGVASVADLEAALAKRVKAFIADPAQLDAMIAELLHGVQSVQAELEASKPAAEHEPEPVTAPDAAPPPAPAAAEPAWEYVYDANGIATGTRPLTPPVVPAEAPETPAPAQAAAPVDAPPAVPAESAT